MDTMQAPQATQTGQAGPGLSTEDYWARMQALRDDLARLRPPGSSGTVGRGSRGRRP
jgi:hypothetical protein